MNVKEIRSVFLDLAQPEKAQGMKAYMKNKFEFYGVPSPERKIIIKEVWNAMTDRSVKSIFQLIDDLWIEPEREMQYLGMELLRKIQKKLEWDDLSKIEYWLQSRSWWDTVDFLAPRGAGSILIKYPDRRRETVIGWRDSNHLWLQRSSLIFQLFYKEKTDFGLMQECILVLTDKKEFFLNKGAGWALRQYSKTNPNKVRKFLKENPDLPGLTKKEASKYI